jgi:death on curing protein
VKTAFLTLDEVLALHAHQIEQQAAAYLFHLIKNHPFVDGNKRIGLAATLAFLGLNHHWPRATAGDLVDLVLGVAEGRTSKAAAAVFLEGRVQPI